MLKDFSLFDLIQDYIKAEDTSDAEGWLNSKLFLIHNETLDSDKGSFNSSTSFKTIKRV